jgi:hypothetical protein
MHDPEFIELRRKFILSLLVIIIFTVLMILFFINKFRVVDSEVIKKLNNKDSLVILYVDESCKNNTCRKIEKYLNDLNVNYYKINIDSDDDYATILNKLDVTEVEVSPPTIMYIDKGELNSTLVDISSKNEISTFIEYNNLSNN